MMIYECPSMISFCSCIGNFLKNLPIICGILISWLSFVQLNFGILKAFGDKLKETLKQIEEMDFVS